METTLFGQILRKFPLTQPIVWAIRWPEICQLLGPVRRLHCLVNTIKSSVVICFYRQPELFLCTEREETCSRVRFVYERAR